MGETTDELIARYRAGETAALEELVARHQRPLFGYIRNMAAGPEEAEEVFQEVWLRVIRGAGAYRAGNFLGWLVRIARNLLIDRARRRRPSVSLDAEPDGGYAPAETIPAPGRDPRGRLLASELGRRVAEAVARLPREQKEVFLMRSEADLPFKRIAAIQRVPLGTALARIRYALLRLRTELKDEYAEIAGRNGT
jgi:RNA polymerase sigma-70 factor (ECF subfamily)